MSEKMELAEAGLRHADGLTAQLDRPHWVPSRAHIEQARNSIKKLAEMILASSPAQEPVTTEPVAWRWKVYGIWHYAGGFPVSGAEPLYAIPAPPQPGREDGELEELVAQAIWEECCPGMKWGQIDHLIYCRMAGAAIVRMRALTGDPK